MKNKKQVFIELNTHCNFNCIFCPHQYLTRKKNIMLLFDLKTILIKLKTQNIVDIEYIMFPAFGEPLLYPYLAEACDMVKSFGFKMVLATNGSLLREEHKKLNIDSIFISFDFNTEKEFRYRRPLDKKLTFKEYRKIIQNFTKNNSQKVNIYIKGMNQYNHPGCITDDSFLKIKLDFKDRENAFKRVKRIAKLFEPRYKGIPNPDIDFEKDVYLPLRKNLCICFDTIKWWGNRILPKNYCVTERTDPFDCKYFHDHFVIFADGNVSFCCRDFDNTIKAGNIFRDDFLYLLEKEKEYSDLSKVSLCRKCMGRIKKL